MYDRGSEIVAETQPTHTVRIQRFAGQGGHCGIGYGEMKGRDVNDVRALCAPVGRLV